MARIACHCSTLARLVPASGMMRRVAFLLPSPAAQALVTLPTSVKVGAARLSSWRARRSLSHTAAIPCLPEQRELGKLDVCRS
jgi:hypothetical protein